MTADWQTTTAATCLNPDTPGNIMMMMRGGGGLGVYLQHPIQTRTLLTLFGPHIKGFSVMMTVPASISLVATMYRPYLRERPSDYNEIVSTLLFISSQLPASLLCSDIASIESVEFPLILLVHHRSQCNVRMSSIVPVCLFSPACRRETK